MDYLDNTFTILTAIVMVYLFFKYRKGMKSTYKQLTTSQLTKVIFTYLITIFITFILIYYGGNWIANLIPFPPIKTVISIVIIMIALSTCLNLLNQVLKRISKGIL